MKVSSYHDAAAFLERAQPALETDEVRNSLMLGVCLRMARKENVDARIANAKEQPYFCTVEEDGRLLLAVMLTPPYNITLAPLDEDAARAIPALIDDLHANKIEPPGVFGPVELAREFAERWTAGDGGDYRLEMQQCLYVLREVKPVPEAPGELRVATDDDVDLIASWARAFQMEALDESRDEEAMREAVSVRVAAGDYVLWEDGRPVSMALRTRPTRRGVTVTAVYTPPALRGRGYATACVAALSGRLLEDGYEFCTLYTDLANPASNYVYRRMGYEPLADFNLYTFDAP